MILVMLQNAWSPMYAGKIWPRERWLGALELSRSGQRLTTMTGVAPTVEGSEFWYDNTTPICGATSSSVVPPDPSHILRLFKTVRPTMIIFCGKQAQRVFDDHKFGYPSLIFTPHPAMRLLSNVACTNIRYWVDKHLADPGTPFHIQVSPHGELSEI